MNSYTTEQLLMCEKADLVKYIEELREAKEIAFTKGYEEAEESLCVDKEYLDEKEDEIKKVKKLYSKIVGEMDMWKEKSVELGLENEKLKERNEELSEEVEKCEEETIPKEFLTEYLRENCLVAIDVDVLKNHVDEIERLNKANEKLKKEVKVSEDIVEKFSIYCEILDENTDAWEDMVNRSEDYTLTQFGNVIHS